jgi:hypothetical protein
MIITSKFKCAHGDYLQMGNQLFLYCACRYYAQLLNCGFYCPSTGIGTSGWGGIIECDVGSKEGEEDFFELIGYFQYEKYVNKKWFTVKDIDINQHYGNYNLDEWCVIHFRGTDYLSSHYMAHKDYYTQAKKKMSEMYPQLKFMVITDDIENAKKYVEAENYVSFSKETDFKMFSVCKYLIVSNSTFSWWASYLNSKKIFCIGPSGWRNDNDLLLATSQFDCII